MTTAARSLLFWGERGLVSTMFFDLYSAATAELWSEFLSSCKFQHPPWAGQQIASVRSVVEPDFSNEGFGHPDAILRVGFSSGLDVVFVLEAKRLPYQKACLPPNNRGGAGYNSTLNGQLELNHCLALALSEYRDGQPTLCEPDWIIHSPYATERRGRVRALKNAAVVEQVANPFAGLPFRSYYHIVVTADSADPFDAKGNTGFWPELYHTDYPFQNCWHQLRSQFGWINWERIRALVVQSEAKARLPKSLFVPTYDANRKNFRSALTEPVEVKQSGDEDLAQLNGGVATCAGTGNLPRFPAPGKGSERGATMIYAPAICANSFIHFSWWGESCALRNYSKSPRIMPPEDRSMRTSHVRARVVKEVVVRNRKRISDTQYWYETTRSLNQSELAQAAATSHTS